MTDQRDNFVTAPGQVAALDRTIRCVRFVYNYALKLTADTWYRRKTRIGYPETSAALAVIRGMDQYGFLKLVAPAPLDYALHRLDLDFRAFHAGAAIYPRFKIESDFQKGSYALIPSVIADVRLKIRLEYPTSTRCFDCGYFLPAVPVTAEWICPSCGVIQNTAINAARNAEAVQAALRANGEA